MLEQAVTYDILKIVRTADGAGMSHVIFKCKPSRINGFLEGLAKSLERAPEIVNFTLLAMEEVTV